MSASSEAPQAAANMKATAIKVTCTDSIVEICSEDLRLYCEKAGEESWWQHICNSELAGDDFKIPFTSTALQDLTHVLKYRNPQKGFWQDKHRQESLEEIGKFFLCLEVVKKSIQKACDKHRTNRECQDRERQKMLYPKDSFLSEVRDELAYRNPDLKTRFCKRYWSAGGCWLGSACKFAHQQSELRRGRLIPCRHYKEGRCRYGDQCQYYHGQGENFKPRPPRTNQPDIRSGDGNVYRAEELYAHRHQE
mmetsp:Transcript_116000/g.211034  ORF Transcript_116000/g.211034 Transcript_116000/m.211034 type:complete len:250 (+) Transcript_116000:151-900(+)